MTIYNFGFDQDFTSIDKLPDFRSEDERQNSPLALFNHQSADLAWAERMTEELINLSGAWVTVFPRTANFDGDELWEEDADPSYKKGIRLKGFFVPQPVAIALTRWGVDTPNETTVVFSRPIIFKTFKNRMIRPGDVIQVPHNTLSPVQAPNEVFSLGNRMDKYRVINAGDTGNWRYRWLYYSCKVENLTGDQTIQVENA